MDAIFYVGKGQGCRPREHLREAFDQRKKKGINPLVSDKVNHIKNIWSEGVGVVILNCFQYVIPDEALTREACMIDAIGLNRLTNKIHGSYRGISQEWSMDEQMNMGIYFLKRALQIFKAEGEKQIFRADIG